MKKRTYRILMVLSLLLYASGFVIALITNKIPTPLVKVNFTGLIISLVASVAIATTFYFYKKNQQIKPTVNIVDKIVPEVDLWLRRAT